MKTIVNGLNFEKKTNICIDLIMINAQTISCRMHTRLKVNVEKIA